MNLLENQKAAETIDSIYIDLESEIMENIARHLSDWNKPIDSDQWLLQKLAEIGALNQENIQLIAKWSGISQTAAERMLNEAAEKAIESIEPGFEAMARRGLADPNVSVPKSRNVKQAMDTMKKQAKGSLNMTNTTMLYKARDTYKLVCAETAKKAIEILNNNVGAVVTGAESRQRALRSTIKQLNAQGITGYVDKRGRNWTPEAYVNMCMRNTAKNVAEEMQTARCLDHGITLIEISSHAGARPKCAKDQGKIFDLNNGSGTTTDADGKKIRYYPWNSSSYGQPDGILGINCHHHKFPFRPGVSLRTYFPTEDMDANDKLYKQTQVQRAMERDVRNQKRECMLFDTVGDTEAFEEASVKLKAKEERLKNYVDSHKDLHRRKDREQIVGFDKEISSKASGKAQSHYNKWAKSIGAESGPKTLAGYYDLKYNDDKESRLYKGYVNAVNKGRISPLVKYDKFKAIAKEIEQQFVGTQTADGLEIKGYTAHFVDRVIGQRSADSPPAKGERNGVTYADISDALKSPKKIGPVVEQDSGLKSKLYFGKNAAVSYNPDTGELVQVQPKRTK